MIMMSKCDGLFGHGGQTDGLGTDYSKKLACTTDHPLCSAAIVTSPNSVQCSTAGWHLAAAVAYCSTQFIDCIYVVYWAVDRADDKSIHPGRNACTTD